MVGCLAVKMGSSTFWDPPSRILLGQFYEILNISSEPCAQELSSGTLLGELSKRLGQYAWLGVSAMRARV